MEKLLTLKETQQKLSVSTTVMNQLVHSIGFPSFKIGRQWRIEPLRLQAWIDGQMQDE